MMPSPGTVLITRGGKPAGFCLPWDRADIPDDVSRGIYAELSGKAREHLREQGVTEDDVLADFKAARSTRR